MDPLFLTFRDNELERGYRSQVLQSASKYKCGAWGALLVLRCVVLVVSQPGDVRAALSGIAPLADIIVLGNIPERVLENHGALLKLAFGLAHSFLALGGGATAIMMSPDSAKVALVLGFTMTQVFTMFCYRLRLPHQVLLNTVTVIFGLAIYLDPICTTVDTMGWSSFMGDLVCMEDRYLGGLFFGSGGINPEICRGLGIAACRQVYMFVHIFFGVFVFSSWLWHSEKKDRIRYVMHQHQALANEIINSTGSPRIGFMEWVYALFLLWQVLMVFTLLSRSTGVGNK